MLVTVKTGLAVNPDLVASLEVAENRDRIVLTMADGRLHGIPLDHGKTASDTFKRLSKVLYSNDGVLRDAAEAMLEWYHGNTGGPAPTRRLREALDR